MTWTQEEPSNGISSLKTEEVRSIKITSKPEKGDKVEHAMDVYPRPIKADPEAKVRENPAHAQIEPTPDWATKNAFRKLQEALAQRADVKILPRCKREPGDESGVLKDG